MTAALLLACSGGANSEVTGTEVPVDGGFYRDVSPAQLSSMLEDKDFVLINTDPSFSVKIPETDLHIPAPEFGQNLDLIPQNKSAKIVVYCQVSMNSSIVARQLVNLGYTNIWNLAGGLIAWQQQGYPVIQE
jgi:rhodanese-related sulfurtransferase